MFALEGAGPVGWRACHPSCARADAGSGTSVRFADADDPPRSGCASAAPSPAVDLQRLRFTAALTEEARAWHRRPSSPTCRSSGIRLVKSFAVSRGWLRGRDDGPAARARTPPRSCRADGWSSSWTRAVVFSPPPAAGFAAMLERVQRVVVADGSVRVLGDDGRRAGRRSGPATGRDSAAASGPCSLVRTAPPPSARAPARAPPCSRTRRTGSRGATRSIPGRWRAARLTRADPSLEATALLRALVLAARAELGAPVPVPRADRDRRPSRRRDHRARGLRQDPPAPADRRWPTDCRSR